ncbi:WD40-repeat-containing domain protein, partial [Dactylonectria estremocensis]
MDPRVFLESSNQAGPIYADGYARIHLGNNYNQSEDRCLADLRCTDPRDDKIRIEDTNGGLLRDSYRWVLDNAEFQRWRDDKHSWLLWIKGDPGNGKTMLLCGIINELTPSTKLASYVDGTLLSYFFCQATDSRINSATAVLRGLIYLLVKQQPSLLSHIRTKYNDAGKALFEDVNAWVALSEIFTNMLGDPNLPTTYLIIDALDECVKDLLRLLDFILQKSASPRVKWIVSSRNIPDIERKLWQDGSQARLSLEIKEQYWHTNRDATIRSSPGPTKSSPDGNITDDNTLKGHTSGVNSITFSPNGKLLASASHDGTVRLWDTTTRVTRFVLSGHTSSVNAVVFSPDGRLVASASTDGTVKLWDTSIGITRITLAGHGSWFASGKVNAVAFSPDSKLVASGSNDKTARLWNTSTGTEHFTLKGHSGKINAVKFSPNGDLLASASTDGTVKLWDISDCSERFTLKGHVEYIVNYSPSPYPAAPTVASRHKFVYSVNATSFSPDGKLVASASDDGTVKLWSTFTGKTQFTLNSHGGVNVVAFSPDSTLVASGSKDTMVRLWSTTGNSRLELKGHTRSVSAITFSPDGKIVASASLDGTIRLCSLLTGTERILKG